MAQSLDKRHTWMMLGVVLLATLMDGLDGSIVNVALPNIGSSFHVDTATVSWVAITYMMVLAGTLVFFARVASNNGIRNIMIVGLILFTAGSAACGFSQSYGMLIASRILQGIGAAMMAATGPMCCVEYLPPSRLAFGLAVVTIGSSVGFALGPAIGGVLVEYLSWHWIFLINIPIGIAAVVMTFITLPKHDGSGKRRIDWTGSALFCSAIFLLIIAVETLSYSNMRLTSVGAIIVCIVLLALFTYRERRCDHPLLNVKLFRRLDFTAIFICLMLENMAYMGMLYMLPFFGEISMRLSSASVGYLLLITAVLTVILGMPVARASDEFGRRRFCIVAGILPAIAFGIFGVLADQMTIWIFVVAMIFMGTGWAFIGGPMASRMVEHADRKDADMASSLTNEAYYIGGALGTALFAMFFTLTSGSEGIDITDVTGQTMLSGFVPVCLLAMAICIIVAVISAVVRDSHQQ